MKDKKASCSAATAREHRAGQIYSFRTSPATEFSPKEANRYAALKILGFRDGCVCFVVLEGIFNQHPTIDAVRDQPHLITKRFASSGDPASCRVPLSWNVDLNDMHFVGDSEITAEDANALATCRSLGPWSGASANAEGEWRWQHDRVAYTQEVNLEKKALEARIAAERERQEQRLKKLTWEILLNEAIFPRWISHPPFPPPEFVAAARAHVRSTILELQALGAKPKRAPVRAILKRCVEWFNEKDAEFGNVIETEEREDICALLEEIAVVAGHPALVDEVNNWRQW